LPEVKPAAGNGIPFSATQEDLQQKVKTPEAGARLNDAHNLEWTVVMNPLEGKEFVVKYGVECPPSETVEYVERYPA
jgi:hypothetical protein